MRQGRRDGNFENEEFFADNGIIDAVYPPKPRAISME
jgi:hypothetical protein